MNDAKASRSSPKREEDTLIDQIEKSREKELQDAHE